MSRGVRGCWEVAALLVASLGFFAGCGSRPSIVEPPPAPELTDSQVRQLLEETIKDGDASSELYMYLVEQLKTGKDASREDASELNNLISEMIVLNEPDKNRTIAKKILGRW